MDSRETSTSRCVPRFSRVALISWLFRVEVPSWSIVEVKWVRPGFDARSNAAPAFTVNPNETKGNPRRSKYMSSSPLLKVRLIGAGGLNRFVFEAVGIIVRSTV